MIGKRLVVSTRSLKLLAAIVWYVGGVVLVLKGASLLVEANTLRPGKGWPWLAVITGAFLGYLKARYLFSKSCRRNLSRIAALDRPRIWQFFKPGFFVALVVMISVGAILSRLAHNHYVFLVGVAVVDLSVGIALLGSSHIFWKRVAEADLLGQKSGPKVGLSDDKLAPVGDEIDRTNDFLSGGGGTYHRAS